MPTVYEQVKGVFDAYGVPAWIWYPISIVESGGQALAIGDNGCSIGLFQLNRCAGQGVGYTVEQLQNPVFNAQVAAVRISSVWHSVQQSSGTQSQALQLWQTAHYSGHPLDMPSLANALKAFVNGNMQPSPGYGADAPGSSTGGGTVTGGTGEPVGLFPDLSGLFKVNLSNLFTGVDLARIGVFVLGAVLVLIALLAILWEPTKPVRDVTGDAIKTGAAFV